MYAFNSFFMSIRSKFLADGVSICYCVVNLGIHCLRLGGFSMQSAGPHGSRGSSD